MPRLQWSGFSPERCKYETEPVTLAAAYERCRQLQAHYGRSFYLATMTLPRWKRRHMHALYGLLRSADEIVDVLDPVVTVADRACLLGDLRDELFAGLATCQTAGMACPVSVAR